MGLSGILVFIIYCRCLNDSYCYTNYPALLFAKVKVRKVIICKSKMVHCFFLFVYCSQR